MQIHYSKRKGNRTFWLWAAVVCALGLPAGRSRAATESPKLTAVPEWHRFEGAFRSDTAYANPLQEARLTVTFVSPLGVTNAVEGFWDGGRTWRVRFAPGEVGRWTFKTACTDWANRGLHNQKGEFTCTSPIGESRFHQHGPVRVALDHRHLEHADGTPFFWLADTAWNGARMSEPKDWERYALIRASQEFTVVQWAAAPGGDAKDESALAGFSDKVTVDPAFFQRLDAKVEALSQAGLLSAIVPYSEVEARAHEGVPLPDEEVAVLTRYVVARYGAEPVAWLVALEGEPAKQQEWVWKQGEQPRLEAAAEPAEKLAARWKRIGTEVFGNRRHAPVVFYAGQTPGLLEKFRDESWVDVLGYPAATEGSDEAGQAWLAGQWGKEPGRVWIPFAPFENGINAKSGKRFAAAEVRRAVYASLFLTEPTGVSYGAQGVANWDASVDQKAGAGAGMPRWEKSLFMPAAKQMTVLANLMESIDFWRLKPAPQFVAQQSGGSSRPHAVAAARADKKLAIVYMPEGRALELGLDALPSSPSIIWVNPGSGRKSPAVAVVGGNACQFPTPEAGDWLLELKSGKPKE